MWRAGYRLLLWLAFPFVLARLWWRGRQEPRYRENPGERFGFYRTTLARPVIWLHAVSLGETRAAEPLLRALKERHPECDLLVTQMTATGRQAAEQMLGGSVRVAWLAYDYPSAVRRFLRHFRPRLGILMETEIWFNLVGECERAGVPLVLANARMSARSARAYAAVGPLVRPALGSFGAVMAQTVEDADRLRSLGARRIEVTGNLKFDMEPAAGSDSLAAQLRQRFGGRKVLLAASTREGEEDLILDALRDSLGGALLVIVPRHPQRFEAVAQLLAARGLKFARRSACDPLRADCEIVLGDSMGEMAAYYRASDVAFIGGSLLAYGGQNLIEACAAGVPVLIGPHS
jgi:3-deoxy-D-manno-octulosonic-acid transferase